MIGRQDHAEAEVEIGTEREDEVGVVIVIIPEGEVENAEATSEDAVIAGTETEIRGGAGAPTDEAETTIKNDGAEVAIRKGRESEVLIEILPGEETAEKTEKVEKKNDHEVDERRHQKRNIYLSCKDNDFDRMCSRLRFTLFVK